MLPDGRQFQVSSAEAGPRGWWFTATAEDGSVTLHGNLEFEWDPSAGVWRPKGTQALPPSMRSAPSAKRKQLD